MRSAPTMHRSSSCRVPIASAPLASPTNFSPSMPRIGATTMAPARNDLRTPHADGFDRVCRHLAFLPAAWHAVGLTGARASAACRCALPYPSGAAIRKALRAGMQPSKRQFDFPDHADGTGPISSGKVTVLSKHHSQRTKADSDFPPRYQNARTFGNVYRRSCTAPCPASHHPAHSLGKKKSPVPGVIELGG